MNNSHEATPSLLSSRPLASAFVISAVATLLLAWPALGGAFLVNPNSDQYIAGFAFREFAANALRAGAGFPQWNPYQFGGMPYVAAMHGDIFYPTFLLRMVLPTDIAMTWGFVLHMILAGVFTMGFLRALGVRFASAAVGGVAYLLSGAVASYASPGHDGKLFVSTLLPAALWAIIRGVRDGRHSAWGTLALIVGLAVLSPHPQLLQYLLLTSAAFALFVASRPQELSGLAKSAATPPKPSLSVHRNRLFAAFGAVMLGAAIGAIQYLPVREYVSWSPRAGGRGYDYATSFSMPIEETLNLYLPQFSGILEHYWGSNAIHLHSEYVGASVLVLASLAFGGGLANRYRAHAWFWMATCIVALFWAWGGNTPFYQLVYAVIPGAHYFRAPSTILYVVAFAISVLAALGVERAWSGVGSKRFALTWTSIALVVALVASSGILTSIARNIAPTRSDAIDANAFDLILGAWRSAAFAIATIMIITAIARGRLLKARAEWLLIATVALDLVSVDHHYWQFSARADALFADDAIITYLKKLAEPARVIAWPLSTNMASQDPFLLGDALMHHGIRGVLGYHGNELGRFQELYGKNEGFQSVANPNFWALTNARYFYTNANSLPIPDVILVSGPVRNAAGSMTYLFELPGVNPAAWVVPLMVKLDDASTKSTVLNPLFDVRRVGLFDQSSAVSSKPVNSPLPQPLPLGVRVSRYEPGAIDLTLDGTSPPGAALIVSENFYPGWTATVDGAPATIARADFTLIGVELPTNARSVSLRFDSATYHTGKQITLVSILTAAALLLIGVVRDRRALAVVA